MDYFLYVKFNDGREIKEYYPEEDLQEAINFAIYADTPRTDEIILWNMNKNKRVQLPFDIQPRKKQFNKLHKIRAG